MIRLHPSPSSILNKSDDKVSLDVCRTLLAVVEEAARRRWKGYLVYRNQNVAADAPVDPRQLWNVVISLEQGDDSSDSKTVVRCHQALASSFPIGSRHEAIDKAKAAILAKSEKLSSSAAYQGRRKTPVRAWINKSKSCKGRCARSDRLSPQTLRSEFQLGPPIRHQFLHRLLCRQGRKVRRENLVRLPRRTLRMVALKIPRHRKR